MSVTSEEFNLQSVFEMVRWSMEESDNRQIYERVDMALKYNTKYSKNERGSLIMMALRTFTKSPKDSDLRIATAVGWCVEMLEAYYCMCYDFVFQRPLNLHGQQSWHRVNDNGLLAVSDAAFIKSMLFWAIKLFVSDQAYYRDIVDLFLESNLKRIIGERLELTFCSKQNKDWELLTMCNYTCMTINKNAFYSLYLPVACAMDMVDKLLQAGFTDEGSRSTIKETLIEIGQLVQILDDFKNCFGEEVPPRGWGRDIKDEKFTWLLARALELASEKQKEILQMNYGQDNDQAVGQVLNIYKSLGIEYECRSFMKTKLCEITSLIHSEQDEATKTLLFTICEEMFPAISMQQ